MLRIMVYFGKINTLAAYVALERVFKEMGHNVLISMKIEDRGELNNAMSAL